MWFFLLLFHCLAWICQWGLCQFFLLVCDSADADDDDNDDGQNCVKSENDIISPRDLYKFSTAIMILWSCVMTTMISFNMMMAQSMKRKVLTIKQHPNTMSAGARVLFLCYIGPLGENIVSHDWMPAMTSNCFVCVMWLSRFGCCCWCCCYSCVGSTTTLPTRLWLSALKQYRTHHTNNKKGYLAEMGA